MHKMDHVNIKIYIYIQSIVYFSLLLYILICMLYFIRLKILISMHYLKVKKDKYGNLHYIYINNKFI